VLAADSPLSLQVHPSIEQAREGFAREESEGIPRSAARRCYKDENHKPELIMALSPFSALCGFVPPELMAARLEYYAFLDVRSALAPAAHQLQSNYSSLTLSQFFSRVFHLSSSELDALLKQVGDTFARDAASAVDAPELAERSAQLFLLPAELKRFSSLLVRLLSTYPNDPGVLVALLLHFIELQPGQALYLPAGVLHSYLQGVGLEIMASSDNVLRGGLTSKYVSLAELERTVNFTAYEPHRLTPSPERRQEGATVTTYDTPAPDFQLSLITLKDSAGFTGKGPDILLVLDGEAALQSSGQMTKLVKGQQAFCSGNEGYALCGNARIARASPGPRRTMPRSLPDSQLSAPLTRNIP
jgi:mannose-6-phosphate isomerase